MIMGKSEEKTLIVKEVFLDKGGNKCKKEDAVEVYVQITDADGKYIDGRMIVLK